MFTSVEASNASSWVPTVHRIIISVESEWFTKYVKEELRLIHICYIAEVTEEIGTVK